ncbi:LysE family translocator [Haloplanus aerogenes]|uniref:LysE family translocator n=1 Tax=Haloplanus aerogenes TaxID=660522 RepID=A0A3M0DP99_9EURY|nr:LysE family translocator [Haloplanus aerogenes]AZH24646.1 LysE family translocator [Haloplanus aerogenes]RMB23698.1 threonine/homoserine/homoserine lactone efflux protein [Haloplanus aerogenes]
MLEPATLAAFVSAAALIVLAPGPDTMYTVTRSLGDGRTAGVVAATGTATGVLIHTAAAVAGLSALLRASATAYTLVKYVGAAYLCYLGVRLLRSDETFDVADTTSQSLADSYRRAVTINVTNPKVAVFVLAFFPQFVPAAADAPVQMSILGLIYAGLSLVYLAGVALFAGRVRHVLLDSGRAQRVVQYVSGSVLIGFGLRLLLDERPAT